MEDTTDYERATAPIVAEVREEVLRLEALVKSGPPGPEAVYVAGLLNGLRRTLAAVECNLETIDAARIAGRDEGWEHGFRRGARLRERRRSDGGARQAVPLRAVPAVAAEAG